MCDCADAAMSSFLDDQIGNVTALFKSKAMWDNTLMICFS
jgi:arylsulfatase A-like enzyme